MTPVSFAVLAFAVQILFSAATAAPENCATAATVCQQNITCKQAFTQQRNACREAYASGLSSHCTPQCNASRAELLRSHPAFADCVCTDYSCSNQQRNIAKACRGVTLPALFCNDLVVDCLNNTNCNKAWSNYLFACSALINGRTTSCTTSCQSSLNALLIQQPKLRTCSCGGETECTAAQNYTRNCIGFTCASVGQYCYNDPTCQPYLNDYTKDCGSLIEGTTSTCSAACRASLDALATAEPYFSEFCDCQSNSQQSCTDEQKRVATCYGGCDAVGVAKCKSDPMCTAALDDHLKYCDAVFRSGKAADCTKNCRTSLDKLYDAFPDFAFCACGTAKCTSNQTNFEKGCFGGKRLCSKISAECSHNQQQCDTDIQNYLNACANVIKTGLKSDCTDSCKSALKAASDATPALETCVCASVDANCTLYQKNFNTSECYYAPGGAERVSSLAVTWFVAVFFLAY
ncbi:low-density lipoprotein receptor-related protein-like isoform X2 [Oscarella lobularis]|uniref:low-density lipoprotein receptor-related protein-like isoform X2 n=1 Tax=Oscarella lobularis TaxID=121494 RepID=UPI003313260A